MFHYKQYDFTVAVNVLNTLKIRHAVLLLFLQRVFQFAIEHISMEVQLFLLLKQAKTRLEKFG